MENGELPSIPAREELNMPKGFLSWLMKNNGAISFEPAYKHHKREGRDRVCRLTIQPPGLTSHERLSEMFAFGGYQWEDERFIKLKFDWLIQTMERRCSEAMI